MLIERSAHETSRKRVHFASKSVHHDPLEHIREVGESTKRGLEQAGGKNIRRRAVVVRPNFTNGRRQRKLITHGWLSAEYPKYMVNSVVTRGRKTEKVMEK